MTANLNEPRKLIYPPIVAARKPDFPSAKYFQVHFEHLESQIELHNITLQKMQEQIAVLCQKLTFLDPDSVNHRISK
jgi:hypothetical protein